VSGDALDPAIARAIDGLLRALALEPVGADRFRAPCEPSRFERVFGGQSLAQALLAAGATVSGKTPDSLHAYFVEAGMPEQPVELAVDRIRDGRGVALRRVAVSQAERPLLVMIASFHANPARPQLGDPAPNVPRPEQLPRMQEFVRDAPPEWRGNASRWIDRPPPVEIRIGEPPYFLSSRSANGPRSHWMRVPREVGEDPQLHTALLAYASDFFLLDMAYRSHPAPVAGRGFTGTSLGHALWFHRPVRFDRWHLHTMETLAISGERGLVRGAIHDADGRLVASVTQEVLVR